MSPEPRTPPALAHRARSLPEQAGIYIFRGSDGAPLYVGKAKSLRKRVASYFRSGPERRLRDMVAEASALDFIVTDTEAEALLLENTWIKQHQPRYNIRLRDDKTYPYVKLTLQELYPKIAFTRRIRNDGAEYFGPYLPAGLARRAIKLVQKLFQIRVCHIEIDGKLPRPCLYYDMKRCLGPCVDGLTDRAEYRAAVEQARLFLAGRNQDLTRRLRRDMMTAADELEFERAARLRDALAEVDAISERRKLTSQSGDDVDIYGVHIAGDKAAVSAFVMRGGQILDRREYFWEGVADLDDRRLLSELLPQIYDRTTFIPKEIHLPVAVDGGESLAQWLGKRKGQLVHLRVPQRGGKSDRVQLAMRNAKMSFRRRFRFRAEDMAGAVALQGHLELDEAPRRIECFDISTLHGRQTVASQVVWEDGRLLKRDYRSYNISGLPAADDFESMRQAVLRAYRRRLDEVGEMPDLIVIDGGRGQLNAALESLAELGVEETPVASLAKREEEVYLPQLPEPLSLSRSDAGLQLLQQIRDEAHRFAVSRHRRRRSRAALRSEFESLHGVGPKRRRQLAEAFPDFATLRQAPLEAIEAVLGPALARRVFEQLRRR